MTDDLLDRMSAVRAFVLDVDGVLTDGSLYYGRSGEALKRFHARDGFAVVTAASAGRPVAVLSGRIAPPLRARLRDLRIPAHLAVQGSRDKAQDLIDLATAMSLTPADVAFMGDDLPDLPALAIAGLAICPSDATREVREACHLVVAATGGNGAVREAIERVLRAQRLWQDATS